MRTHQSVVAACFVVGLASCGSGTDGKPEPVRQAVGSPFDKLDAATIPAEKRLPGQPKELLAVLNEADAKGYVFREIALSRDGRWLATAGGNGVVQVFDCATLKEVARARGNCPDFAPDSKTLAFLNGQEVHLWDVSGQQPKERLSFVAHPKPLDALAFSPDGKTLATGSRDTTIRLWDVSAEKERALGTLEEHAKGIEYLSFSPDGKMLASCSGDRTARVHDMEGGQGKVRAVVEHKNSGGSVRFSPDGKLLGATTPDEKGTLWDLTAKEPKVHARLLGHDRRVTAVSFSGDGKTVVSTSTDGRVIFWDVSGKKVHEWTMPHAVSDALFTPDGNYVVVGNGNGTVYILRRPK